MEEIAQVYARSLFEVAKEQDKLDVVREQLGQFAEALDGSPDLSTFFFAPYFSTKEKEEGLGKLLDGVDPIGVEATMDVIADARARGACTMVSTHLRELAIQACGEVLVLRGGSRVATVGAAEMAGEEGARAYRALLD